MTRWIAALSALLASLPAVAAAADMFIATPPTEWSHFIVPAALLCVMALSLGAMAYLVASEVAKRLGPPRI